jgi:uncharacterized protein
VAYFVLQYDVVENYVELRGQFREEHLGIAKESHDRGELVLAGALGDPIDSALLVFRTDDAMTVENFARNDPYVLNGLVRNWTVKPWNVVIG